MKFTKEYLENELEVCFGGNDLCKVIKQEMGARHRWYHDVRCVFQILETGKYYETEFAEYTGDEPGDRFFSDPVECPEVTPVTRMIEVTEYIKV